MTPFSLPTRITFKDQSALRRVLTDKLSTASCVLFLREADADRFKLRPSLETKQASGLIWIQPDDHVLSTEKVNSIIKDLRSAPIKQVLAFGDQRVTRLAKAVIASLDFQDHPMMSAILIGSDPEILDPNVVLTDRTTGFSTLDCSKSRFNDLLICEALADLSDTKALLTDGLGALTQASLAYWTPSSSPIVQRLSLKAVELIIRNLPKVLEDPLAKPARIHLIDGFLLSSMVSSNVTPSVIHEFALCLGAKAKVPFSWIEALILPDLLRHNLGELQNPEGLYEAYDIDNPQALGIWTAKVREGLIPQTLSVMGLTESDLDEAIALAYANHELDRNPVELSPAQLKTYLLAHV